MTPRPNSKRLVIGSSDSPRLAGLRPQGRLNKQTMPRPKDLTDYPPFDRLTALRDVGKNRHGRLDEGVLEFVNEYTGLREVLEQEGEEYNG